MYYYSTVNNIIMSHSAIIPGDLCDTVNLHFERPNESGFDFLDMVLPGEIVQKIFRFFRRRNAAIKEIRQKQRRYYLGLCR